MRIVHARRRIGAYLYALNSEWNRSFFISARVSRGYF